MLKIHNYEISFTYQGNALLVLFIFNLTTAFCKNELNTLASMEN